MHKPSVNGSSTSNNPDTNQQQNSRPSSSNPTAALAWALEADSENQDPTATHVAVACLSEVFKTEVEENSPIKPQL
eukprot:1525915-Amphidinium_carterae.1